MRRNVMHLNKIGWKKFSQTINFKIVHKRRPFIKSLATVHEYIEHWFLHFICFNLKFIYSSTLIFKYEIFIISLKMKKKIKQLVVFGHLMSTLRKNLDKYLSEKWLTLTDLEFNATVHFNPATFINKTSS